MPSGTNLRRHIVYHSPLSPYLAARKPHYDDQHMRDAPLKAHLRTLVLQLVDNIYFSPISPLMVLSAQKKHYNFFGFT